MKKATPPKAVRPRPKKTKTLQDELEPSGVNEKDTPVEVRTPRKRFEGGLQMTALSPKKKKV